MKKNDLKTLALLGLTGGLLLGQQGANAASNSGFQETPWVVPGDHKCGGAHGCSGALQSNGCKGRGGCGGLMDHKCGSGGKCGSIAVRDEADSPDKEYVNPGKDQDPNQSNMKYHLMTEQELMLELNSDGVRMYNSLDDQGKALARRVASMMCAGTNECKGLNGCMTDKNSCAGKGACKGKGKCAISDKNLAVKLVYDKMAAKRADMLNQ
ncbi:MAG: hypothetical protein LLG04_17695 [Parachlamydia sp.]|nr:hypothetical protein [Parachlamydia sp.]